MSVSPEQRRVVTVLVADLVGSTALTQRLDPEDARLILGDAVARVVLAVEAFGGHVKDLAGDGVLALFGAPVAHEDDPERAARAALEIVRSIREYGAAVQRGWDVDPLAVRVAVHTGEVVTGEVGAGGRFEYGAVGDPVNATARLQSAAQPGTVLVSEATHRFVADSFEWGPSQLLELRGRSEPLTAYTLLRPSTAGAPAGEGAVPVTPLVGRDTELERLGDAAAELAGGRGGIVFIVGEPGIGKSRLAAELRRIAVVEHGVAWLEGRCASYGESLQYWPYRDLIRNWLGAPVQDADIKVSIGLRRRLGELLGDDMPDAYPHLAGVLGLSLEPDVAASVGQLSPESAQYRTFEIVIALLTRIATRQPTVVFIDDLHWADATSLALTDRLLAIAETEPLLLVAGMRPETEHGAWALKERAAREYRHIQRDILLEPLSHRAESELVRVLGGDALPADVVATILEYAAGSPLFLEELVRSVQTQDAALHVHGRLEIPATLEGVILARIDRLDPVWREVLTAGAALGRSFSIELLAAVSDRSSAEVRDAVHHLMRSDLLRDDRSAEGIAYGFKHALIQGAAYRSLVTSRRHALHHRAAQWLEVFYEGRLERVYGLLAHHWRAADDIEKAAEFTRLAGMQAQNEWALDEAVEHFRELLPLLERLGRDEEASERLFQLGTTLHQAMRYREANEVWADAFARWRQPPPVHEAATATLRVGGNMVPTDGDPHGGYYAVNQQLLQQLYDRLLEARQDGYVVPGLAEWWDVSEDGLRYRVRLREGLTWNDGRPMSADDAVAAFHRVMDPAQPSPNAEALAVIDNADRCLSGELPLSELGVRAIDARTIEYRLCKRCPYFIFHLVIPEFSVMRPDLAASGAFRLVSMSEELVVAERDPGYTRRRGGNVARIEWILHRDAESLASTARADAIDVTWGNRLPPGPPETLGMQYVYTPVVTTMFVSFPGVDQLVTSTPLRRALALAVDRDRIAPLLPHNLRIATGGLVPPGLAGHTPGIALRFDPDAARAELANSGFGGLLRFIAPHEQHLPHVDAVVESWREVLGITVDVTHPSMFTNRTWGRQAHAAWWQWLTHAPDPEYFLRDLLFGGSHSKIGGWTLPKLDDLLERASRAEDGTERLEQFHRADRLAVGEECVVIPIIYRADAQMVKTWVHGWWHRGVPWQTWDEVTIDETSPRHQ